jgi:hypothetical protein
MARRARVLIEGGVYHVYNRVASGEPVFADPDFARRLDALDRELAESAAGGKGSAGSW